MVLGFEMVAVILLPQIVVIRLSLLNISCDMLIFWFVDVGLVAMVDRKFT
jgi:hypothetical protein